MQISLAFSANLLSETPSISPLKGEARPSKSPKTHPKNQGFFGDPAGTPQNQRFFGDPARTPQKSKIFRGPRKNTPKIKDFSGTPKRPCTTQHTSYKTKKRRHKPPFIFDKTYREELKISLYVISHSLFCVAKPGLEPRQTEPESVVLPLHHLAKIPRSIRNRRAPISRKRCKITAFF